MLFFVQNFESKYKVVYIYNYPEKLFKQQVQEFAAAVCVIELSQRGKTWCVLFRKSNVSLLQVWYFPILLTPLFCPHMVTFLLHNGWKPQMNEARPVSGMRIDYFASIKKVRLLVEFWALFTPTNGHKSNKYFIFRNRCKADLKRDTTHCYQKMTTVVEFKILGH